MVRDTLPDSSIIIIIIKLFYFIFICLSNISSLNRFDIDINLKTNDGTTRAEGIPKMNTILHISTLQLTFSETKKISIESLRKSICTMCSTFPNLTLFVIVANVLPNKVRLVSRDTDRYSGKAGGTDEELNKETLDEDEHFALVVFKLVQPYEHILFRFLNFQVIFDI